MLVETLPSSKEGRFGGNADVSGRAQTMSHVRDFVLKSGLVAGFAALATPALAGTPVPVPLLGAGVPALIALGGAYYLIRRARKRD